MLSQRTPRSFFTFRQMTESNHSDYVRKIRRELPAEAFAPAPRKLVIMLAHLGIIISCYVALRGGSTIWLRIVLALLIGHSLVCIGFLTHELAHGAVVRSRRWRYLLEMFFWGINLIPATVWRRVHNQTHHLYANTLKDPDRPFLDSEQSPLTRWYTHLFYPGRCTMKWNPLVALHLVGYTVRNTIAAFYPRDTKPAVAPSAPRYSTQERITIGCEVAVIVLIQYGIFLVSGRNLMAYLWVSPIAYAFTSAGAMVYIFTNHFLNPISETHDPLLHTTSVTVPRFIDRLHVHFSLHTEHHLFPSVNSDYYPLVAASLRRHFPDRYQCLPLLSAWKQLWRRKCFATVESFRSGSPARRPADRPGSTRTP